jgi:uncharacterized protein (TIGR03000 family)
MNHRHARYSRWLSVTAGLLLISPECAMAAGGGHGGAGLHGGVGGHPVAGGWHGGPGGWHGAYPYGYRGWGGYGWGWPGWYGAGFGLGVGLGYAAAYPYGYGYPYPYAYQPGVVVNVPPAYPPPPGAGVAGAPPAPGGAPAPGMAPPQGGPVRLTDADVLIHVRVPPDAAVWLNDKPTTQTGPQREFASSGLIPGRQYTFTVEARWTDPGGAVVDQQRRLSVTGGERRTVDFTMPENGPPLAPPR